WRRGGRVAVLTPSRRGGFADSIVDLVCTRSLGRQQNGPYRIRWESGDDVERGELWARLVMPEQCSIPEGLAVLRRDTGAPAIRAAGEWVARQKRVLGVEEVTAAEVRRQIDRTFAMQRRHGPVDSGEFLAMTVQQGKNREFDHVVVIWPYTIPDNNEQKRRLLYNAVTPAQLLCFVLGQARELLDAPPFVG